MPEFELIQHKFLGGHDITIFPVFDVHLGSPQCMEQRFIQFIKKVTETPNAYLVLGGDLIENGVRSSIGDAVFRQTMPPSQQKKEMANILAPARDRILCLTDGNHERRSGKDADDSPVYDIAAKLDLEHLYRPNIAFVKIQLGRDRNEPGGGDGVKRPTYVLVVTHGSGGGILTGASVNRNERFGYTIDGMDALIVGHTHKPVISQPGKVVIDPHNNKVSIRPFKVITATSWLEYGGYAAQKMLLPATHCMHTITLCGDHKEMIVTM